MSKLPAPYKNEIKVMREHCDKLGLGDKDREDLNMGDLFELSKSLRNDKEVGLADYVESLKDSAELEDLLVNMIYE